jgi:hypothetical protein
VSVEPDADDGRNGLSGCELDLDLVAGDTTGVVNRKTECPLGLLLIEREDSAL